MTKHEQILNYIESLSIGSKISVRKIAKGIRGIRRNCLQSD